MIFVPFFFVFSFLWIHPGAVVFAEAGRLKRLPPFLFCAFGCIQTPAPLRSAAVR
jgi:hypothetical protein